jgi:soluble lytic murein transglycosylase
MALKTRIILFPAQASGFLQGTKRRALGGLVLFLTLSNFVSCESSVVLGIPRDEVLQNLKSQNIDFILKADLEKMDELTKLHHSAPFYVGLLVKAAGGDSVRAEVLFEAALKSSSEQVRKASAAQLLPFLLQKDEDSSLLKRIEKLAKNDDFENDSAIRTLKNAARYLLGHYNDMKAASDTDDFLSWNRGFMLLANLHANEHLDEQEKHEIRDYFLVGMIDEARMWAFQELQSLAPSWMSSAEMTAIEGRIAVSRSSFNEGIALLKAVIEENQALFFVYIDLLHDLGRAYQFTQYQQEGIERFREWEAWLQTGAEMGTSILTINHTEIRYRLLYFIGRIEQQRQNYAESIHFFAEAVKLTADSAQQDACIWYILNAVLLENPAEVISYLKEYEPKWNDDAYFADIMDRLSQYITFSGDWDAMLEVFNLIRDGNDGPTIAKYAYIIARALMEGYISQETVSGTEASSAEDFFRIAFEKSGQSFFYKALSSSFLGETIDPFAEKPESNREKQDSQNVSLNEDNLEFMLRFFNYGAEQFAYLYFRNLPLSIDEQRIVAENFIQAENWYTAIRVCSVFMNRNDYELQRGDLEMLYPKAYSALIEQFSVENEIPEEIFFGLVRTESAFNKDADSWAGAVGLSQLMEETAFDMAGRIARRGGPNYIVNDEIDMLDPETNLHIGAWYLNYLIDYTDSPMLALLAYNGGMGRVRRWRAAKTHLPEDLFLETIAYAETRDYGRKVLGAAAAYGYLYYDLSMEEVIADIFR